MFSNQNVSNQCKYILFKFFKDIFQNNAKFNLYKNILEWYLALSNGCEEAFLFNLRDDAYKFLSVADPSALKNKQLKQLAERLHNYYDHSDEQYDAEQLVERLTTVAKRFKNDYKHNDIIKNYLTKDTYHRKYIKAFNIYSSLLQNNLFVVNDDHYNKITNMINPNQMKPYPMRKDLIKLVLCYFSIDDLLELDQKLLESFQFPPRAKLKVKYLDNIVLEFRGPKNYTSTSIQAVFDAIEEETGVLSNTVQYKHDPCWRSIHSAADIDPKLIEHSVADIDPNAQEELIEYNKSQLIEDNL